MPFAPAPIRIRYGPSGLLGAAVAEAAKRERFQADRDLARQRDDAFLASELDRRQARLLSEADRQAALQQAALANALEGRRLQLAHQLRLAELQAAGAQRRPTGNGGEQTLKQAILENLGAGLSPNQRGQLASLVADEGVAASQFDRLLGAVSAQAQGEKDKLDKKRYLERVLPTLPESERAGIAALADADDVSLSDLRIAVSDSFRRSTAQKNQERMYQIQAIDTQVRALRQQMDNLAAQLAERGFDVNATTPAEFNPQVTQPTYSDTFLGRMAAAYLPGTTAPETTGGDPQARQLYVAYQRLARDLNGLLAARQQLIQGAGQTPESAASSGSTTARQMTDEELLAALAS